MSLGIVSKTVIWVLLAVGMLPAIYVVLVTFYVLTLEPYVTEGLPQPSAELAKTESHGFTQHALVKVGPLEVKFFPRFWAAGMAVTGAVLLIGGVFILLHVPTPWK